MAQNLDELFDVVDEQDRVTGQAARREVHARGWRHRAVHLLVVNAQGQVFLQKRSMTKDLFPGIWDSSAAGHVGAGEDYDGTAVRELEEELGLKLPPPSGVGYRYLLPRCAPRCAQGASRPSQGEAANPAFIRAGRPAKALRSQIQPLFKIEARAETGQEFVWVYRVESEGPFVLQADEIESGDWFSREAIERWIEERPQELAPAFLYLWPKARTML